MEAAGVALGIPGVIDVLIRGGEFLVEKVDLYQHTDDDLNQSVHPGPSNLASH